MRGDLNFRALALLARRHQWSEALQLLSAYEHETEDALWLDHAAIARRRRNAADWWKRLNAIAAGLPDPGPHSSSLVESHVSNAERSKLWRRDIAFRERIRARFPNTADISVVFRSTAPDLDGIHELAESWAGGYVDVVRMDERWCIEFDYLSDASIPVDRLEEFVEDVERTIPDAELIVTRVWQ